VAAGARVQENRQQQQQQQSEQLLQQLPADCGMQQQQIK
jgi:hypothetical protein